LRTRLGDCLSEPAAKLVMVGQSTLSIVQTPTGPALSWPGIGYRLQETDDLTPPVQWNLVVTTPIVLDGWNFVEPPEPEGTRFYRLEQSP
jgi:hypothetical protein